VGAGHGASKRKSRREIEDTMTDAMTDAMTAVQDPRVRRVPEDRKYETVTIVNGLRMICPASPDPCDYVRVEDDNGNELCYWSASEFADDPKSAMGALLGCLHDAEFTQKLAATEVDVEITCEDFHIHVEATVGGSGLITSNLRGSVAADHDSDEDDSHPYNAAMSAIESIILAHACAGVNVATAAYLEGIAVAVEAVANNYDTD
jgi:hypothetical protein